MLNMELKDLNWNQPGDFCQDLNPALRNVRILILNYVNSRNMIYSIFLFFVFYYTYCYQKRLAGSYWQARACKERYLWKKMRVYSMCCPCQVQSTSWIIHKIRGVDPGDLLQSGFGASILAGYGSGFTKWLNPYPMPIRIWMDNRTLEDKK
jgi:hypothetical protein